MSDLQSSPVPDGAWFDRWTPYSDFGASLPPLVAERAAWLARRHGLTPLAGCIIALLSVSYANGPCHRIVSPIDNAVLPTTLAVVLHGTSALQIGAAMSLEIQPLRRWIKETLGSPDGQQRQRVRLRQAEIHAQLQKVRQALAVAGRGGAVDHQRFAASNPERNAQFEGLQTQVTHFEAELRVLAFGVAPHVIVEGAALGHFRDPGRLATDGCVFSVDPRGGNLTAMLSQASVGQRRHFARLLGNSWSGAIDAGEDEIHRQPLIGSAAATTTAAAVEVMREYPEVSRHHLFIEAASGEALQLAKPFPEAARDKWLTCLDAIMIERMDRISFIHRYAADAAGFYVEFVAQALARASRSAQPERFERAAFLSAKLALLLHLASEHRDKAIPVATVEAGCALAWTVARQDFDFASSFRAPPGLRTISGLQRVVARLRSRGAMTWRELLRSSHQQKAAPLEAVLRQGLESGCIFKNGDTYVAAP